MGTTNTNNILNNKMTSQVRQNYHEDCEALINKQINMEFYASYVYLSMASYFNRDDQALHGFAKFFQKSSDEERDHGMKLMEYQAKRGGRSSSKTLPSQAALSGVLLSRPWRQLLNWRRPSTRACWIFTRLVMEKVTLISVISLRPSSLESRLRG